MRWLGACWVDQRPPIRVSGVRRGVCGVLLLCCALLLSFAHASPKADLVRSGGVASSQVHIINAWSALSDEAQFFVVQKLLEERSLTVVGVYNVTWGPECEPLERCYQRYFLDQYVQIFLLDVEGKARYTPHTSYKGSASFLTIAVIDPSPILVTVDKELVNLRMDEVCNRLTHEIGYLEVIDCSKRGWKGERDLKWLLNLDKSAFFSPSGLPVRWDQQVREITHNGEMPGSTQWMRYANNSEALSTALKGARQLSAYDVVENMLRTESPTAFESLRTRTPLSSPRVSDNNSVPATLAAAVTVTSSHAQFGMNGAERFRRPGSVSASSYVNGITLKTVATPGPVDAASSVPFSGLSNVASMSSAVSRRQVDQKAGTSGQTPSINAAFSSESHRSASSGLTVAALSDLLPGRVAVAPDRWASNVFRSPADEVQIGLLAGNTKFIKLFSALPIDTKWYHIRVHSSALAGVRVVSDNSWGAEFGECMPVGTVYEQVSQHPETIRKYEVNPIETIQTHGTHLRKIQSLRKAVAAGASVDTTLVLFGRSEDGPFTLLDGNHRAIAFYERGVMLSVIVGISSKEWFNFCW